MSDTAEREMELVAGVIGGITQKKADTWTVAVTSEGSNYAKNLWTKDADLVESLAAKIGQQGAFVGSLGPQYTVTTPEGEKKVRSWWIDRIADGTENLPDATTPDTAPKVARVGPNANGGNEPRSEGMSKEEWARKDSAIHKMACIKTAADALKHTLPSDPTPDDVSTFLSRVAILAHAWHNSVLAERDDPAGDNIPF